MRRHACEAANGMIDGAGAARTKICSPRRRLGGTELPLVEIGIGIATRAGDRGRLRRTWTPELQVNGDAVRLAGRLQALSRNYGPAVIVAEQTQRSGRSAVLPFWKWIMSPQGRDDPPVRLYAMLDNPVVRASPKIPRPGHLSRAYLPVAEAPAMGQGARAGRAMPQPVGRQPDAL